MLYDAGSGSVFCSRFWFETVMCALLLVNLMIPENGDVSLLRYYILYTTFYWWLSSDFFARIHKNHLIATILSVLETSWVPHPTISTQPMHHPLWPSWFPRFPIVRHIHYIFFLPGRTRKTCPMFGVKRSFSLIGPLVPWARPGFDEAEATDRWDGQTPFRQAETYYGDVIPAEPATTSNSHLGPSFTAYSTPVVPTKRPEIHRQKSGANAIVENRHFSMTTLDWMKDIMKLRFFLGPMVGCKHCIPWSFQIDFWCFASGNQREKKPGPSELDLKLSPGFLLR